MPFDIGRNEQRALVAMEKGVTRLAVNFRGNVSEPMPTEELSKPGEFHTSFPFPLRGLKGFRLFRGTSTNLPGYRQRVR